MTHTRYCEWCGQEIHDGVARAILTDNGLGWEMRTTNVHKCNICLDCLNDFMEKCRGKRSEIG